MRKPRKLIENRVNFTCSGSEVSIYDTYRTASRVELDAEDLLLCGMIAGRKIMHARDGRPGLEFLPHENYVMAPGQKVEIDFPEALPNSPTTCLTLEITPENFNRLRNRLKVTTNGKKASQHLRSCSLTLATIQPRHHITQNTKCTNLVHFLVGTWCASVHYGATRV
jgi:hypothetical protein